MGFNCNKSNINKKDDKLDKLLYFDVNLQTSIAFLNLIGVNTRGFLSYHEKNGNIYSSLVHEGYNKIDIDYVEEKLRETLIEVENLRNKFILIHTNIDLIILNKIDYLESYLKMLIYSLPLEGEKAGITISDNKKRKELSNKVKKYQKLIYGKEIHENLEEVSEVIIYLKKIYKNNGILLSNEERNIFLDYMKKYGVNKLDYNKNKINNIYDENKNNIKITKENFKEIIEKTLLLTEIISPSKYNGVKMTDFKVIFKRDNFLSVNFEKKEIILPENRLFFDIKDLELIDHEIITHVYRAKNSYNNIGGFVSSGYIESEEGNAIAAQYFANSKEKLEEGIANPNIGFISNFFGEKNNLKDTEKLISIYLKLINFGNIKEIEKYSKQRAIRTKGFYSIYENGANMKNLGYYRGLKIAGKLLLEGDLESIKKQYNIGKIGFNDEKYFLDFYKDIPLPIFIGKLLISKINGEKIFFNSEFNNKTWKKFDPRYEYSDISNDAKKIIISMLKIIDNSIFTKI